jgi:hypothetical protein
MQFQGLAFLFHLLQVTQVLALLDVYLAQQILQLAIFVILDILWIWMAIALLASLAVILAAILTMQFAFYVGQELIKVVLHA